MQFRSGPATVTGDSSSVDGDIRAIAPEEGEKALQGKWIRKPGDDS